MHGCGSISFLLGCSVTLNETRKPNGTLAVNGVGKFNDINDAALSSIRKIGVHAHLADWRSAAGHRDRLLGRSANRPMIPTC